jgi:hypothetical protein
MIRKRRKADVSIKEAAKATRKWLNKESGQTIRGEKVSTVKDSADAQDQLERHELSGAICELIAKAKKITCKCPEPSWGVKNVEDVKLEDADEDTHELQLTLSCKKCKTMRSVIMSVGELKRLHSRLN